MSEPININTADATALTSIKGIGPALAERILALRQQLGRFDSVAELTQVRGISDQRLEEWAGELVVSDIATTETTSEAGAEVLWATGSSAEPADLAEGGDSAAIDLDETVPADLDEAEEAPLDEAEALVPAAAEAPELTSEEGAIEMEPLTLHEEELFGEGEGEPMLPDEAATEPPVAALEDALEVEEAPAEALPEPELVVAPAEMAPAPAPETGSLWRDLLLLGGAALAGVILTLAILSLLNGTLRFAQRAALEDTRLENEADFASLESGQTTINTNVDNLNAAAATGVARQETFDAAMATAAAESSQLRADLADLEAALATAESELSRLDGRADSLNESIEAVDMRIDTVGAAAERFDQFLAGLQQLLATTAAPEAATLTPTPTTVAPTRTPRPTATPLAQPTATPSS